jgi:Xaa-Pro aminopeptidase
MSNDVEKRRREAEKVIRFEFPVLDESEYFGRRACGTNMADYEQRVDVHRMRQYRMNRVKEQLKANGAGTILCFNEWNVRYCASTMTPLWTTGGSGLRYSLLPANDRGPIIYEQGEIGYHTRQMAPWVEKVKVAITGAGWIGRVMGPNAYETQKNKLVRQIVGDLKDLGLDKQPLAIDTYDPGLIEGFRKEGIEVDVSGGMMMLHARKIKNPDEVECIRIACSVGEACFSEITQRLRPGLRESQIMGIAYQKAFDMGAEVYGGMLVSSGPFSWPNPRDTSDRIIRPGDGVFVDVYNLAFLGYKTCYYRTFTCGKASQTMKDDYKRAYEWLYSAIDIIKPGITTKDIAQLWPEGPEVWKNILVQGEDQTAGSNWGHGIGLSLYELPIIWRGASLDDPVTIEEGMTFAIETQHGTPNVGGARIEEVIHVTKNGAEVLSKWPIEEITEVPYL